MRLKSFCFICLLLINSVLLSQNSLDLASHTLEVNQKNDSINHLRSFNDEPSERMKDKKTNRGLVLQLFGPNFYSSIGFFIDQNLNDRLAIQYDLKLTGTFDGSENFFFGPALKQSLIFGEDRLRIKLGITEALVFNPRGMNNSLYFNDYSNVQPGKYTPNVVYLFALHVGPEIEVKKGAFYITPELILNQLNERVSKENEPFKLKTVSSFKLTVGIEFKFKF